jgi:hypothetical protein
MADDAPQRDRMKEMQEAEEAYRKELARPLTKADCPKMTQLQIDALNVFEKRVKMRSFPASYQQKIKNYYRYSPVDQNSSNGAASQSGRGSWK